MGERLGAGRGRKEAMKDIIRALHEGMTPQQAKERFLKEVGNVTSTEIAEMEQSLINEGLPTDEIKRFCNVHVLLFESALQAAPGKELSEAHPVHLFKLENRGIEKLTGELKGLAGRAGAGKERAWREQVRGLLGELRGLNIHYTRKEQLLFPYLEKAGFFGPSKVMWGKDDEVRDLLKAAARDLESGMPDAELARERLAPLVEEVDGMIFKEENILFPTSLEKLKAADWVNVLRDSEEVGYAFIEKPEDVAHLVMDLEKSLVIEPVVDRSGRVFLPTGSFALPELVSMLNALPLDLTFIDRDDTVRYFSAGKDRIFVRTTSIIGRKVQNCHPPKSVDVVEKILGSFKAGERDTADFWIDMGEKKVHIRYFAVRGAGREYLGTLEVTQDIAPIKRIEGQKRLLDWK